MHTKLPSDVQRAIECAEEAEPAGLGKRVLARIRENLAVSEEKRIPMCQDTGMLLMFVSLGEDIFINGSLNNILEEAAAAAYRDGYFRKSTVTDPLKERINSGDNLPVLIHYDYHPGKDLKIGILAKGFGSENCSRTYMLNPTQGQDAVIEAVTETIQLAGGKPCPPTVVGIGIGGTLDIAARLSKQALLRSLGDSNPDPYYAALEAEILKRINSLGIGPGGLGGGTTSLGVLIETAPTHIAGLPLAVTVNCWADRKGEVVL